MNSILFFKEFSDKIRKFLYSHLELFKIKNNFYFPWKIKIIFLIFLIFLILRGIFQSILIDFFPNISLFAIVYSWDYVSLGIILLIVFYLCKYNQVLVVIRYLSPIILYILILVFSKILVNLISVHVSMNAFLQNSNNNNFQTNRRVFYQLFVDPFLNSLAIILFFIIDKQKFKQIINLIKKHPLFVILYITFIALLYLSIYKKQYLIDNQINSFDDVAQTLDVAVSKNEQAIINLTNQINRYGKVIFIFNLVFVVPIWEEILFRSGIQTIFSNQKNQGWIYFLFFATVLFALAHFSYLEFGKPQNFSEFTSNLFFGVNKTNFSYWYSSYILTIVYLLGGYNLFFPIIIHVFNNVVNTI